MTIIIEMHRQICRFVMNALKAKEFYQRDVQYMVRDGKALIINEVLQTPTCLIIYVALFCLINNLASDPLLTDQLFVHFI